MSEAPFLKDGRLERAGLSPLLSAILGLMTAFLLFQGISAVVLIGFVFMSGVSLTDLMDPSGLSSFLTEHADIVIWSNTIGQVFGLLLPGLWFARLHSSTLRSFLRLRSVPIVMVVLAVIGLLALIPVVQWSATLFDGLPWPQWIRDMEEGQMALIEQVLMQDFSLVFTISMLALTPAICEEVLFRGFVQRQAERRLGAWGGILFSGIIFGFYHLRLTQAIPLSLLGIFMAWLTWRTRSLWPAIIVHLLNNSFAAVLGKMASREESTIDVDTFEFPMVVTAVSALVLGIVVMLIHRVAVRRFAGDPANAGGPANADDSANAGGPANADDLANAGDPANADLP